GCVLIKLVEIRTQRTPARFQHNFTAICTERASDFDRSVSSVGLVLQQTYLPLFSFKVSRPDPINHKHHPLQYGLLILCQLGVTL
ncbi:MAG: hypothetical protein MUQ96_08830, partial [Loktanella sp.]|nr:hypothetical protein [Loktanella sp.]